MEALEALLRAHLHPIQVSRRPLERAVHVDASHAAPHVAIVAVERWSEEACRAVTSYQRRGTRVAILAPSAALPRLAQSVSPAGALSNQATSRELARMVQALSRGELHLPVNWRSWRKSLTQRQDMLFACLVRGDSLKQAAAELGVHYKTAECHRTQLFRKLGVRSRVEMILRFNERANAISTPSSPNRSPKPVRDAD
jgi:DNA-binding NarL/FixJ family response regulator